MTTLKYTVPTVGEKVTAAEPKVDTALTEIKTVVNGELNSENLKEKGVNKDRLSEALQTELGSFVGLPLESTKSIIATEETREAVTYGTLATPDEVEVTIPENGLIAVGYVAQWKESVAEAGRAAIFLNAVQTHVNIGGVSETTAAMTGGGTSKFTGLSTFPGGLISATPQAGSLGTASLAIATGAGTGGLGAAKVEIGGSAVTVSTVAWLAGGLYWIAETPAGAYKVSVRFKATSGKVTVKSRRLWAFVVG